MVRMEARWHEALADWNVLKTYRTRVCHLAHIHILKRCTNSFYRLKHASRSSVFLCFVNTRLQHTAKLRGVLVRQAPRRHKRKRWHGKAGVVCRDLSFEAKHDPSFVWRNGYGHRGVATTLLHAESICLLLLEHGTEQLKLAICLLLSRLAITVHAVVVLLNKQHRPTCCCVQHVRAALYLPCWCIRHCRNMYAAVLLLLITQP